jgi:chemotaxis protein methyltransferase CheR
MPLASSDMDFLRGIVADQSGNVIAPRQIYLLEQRLTPLAESMGLADVEGLVKEIRRSHDPTLKTKIAEAVTVNETSFFRDGHPFDALRTSIIPELVRKNEAKRSIRIWCAACSSGQEPVSIAMTIREGFPALSNWKIDILATDLSEEVLVKCRRGSYSQLEVNRGLPARKLVHFFERSGVKWQAKPKIRNRITYQRLNLTKPLPFIGQFDIVFIRNVLIYFDQPTKTDILKRVHKTLIPGGYLFIGSAETVIGMGLPYRREEIDATVCYRPTTA